MYSMLNKGFSKDELGYAVDSTTPDTVKKYKLELAKPGKFRQWCIDKVVKWLKIDTYYELKLKLNKEHYGELEQQLEAQVPACETIVIDKRKHSDRELLGKYLTMEANALGSVISQYDIDKNRQGIVFLWKTKRASFIFSKYDLTQEEAGYFLKY